MITSNGHATRTAVVMTTDGVRFVAFGPDAVIAQQLASYVSQRCEDTLWPNDARRVRVLVEERRFDEAIATYFATVGQRRDDERLELHAHDSGEPTAHHHPGGESRLGGYQAGVTDESISA